MQLKHKLKVFLSDKQNIILLIVLALALYLRIKYFNINTAIWWDEGDYLSYARKLAFNLETKDLWYYRRVFFIPLFWSFLYKIGFQELGLRIFQLIFSFAGVIGIYLLTKELFNKKTALITTFLYSSYWVHLFFTARLLTDIPAVTFTIYGLYYFLKGYINKEKNKYIYISAILLGLGIFIKLSTLFYIIPLVILILTQEKHRVIKNKHLWIFTGIIFIILLPFIINIYKHYPENPITSFIGHYTGIKAFPGSEDVTPRTFIQVTQQFKDFSYHLKTPLLILFFLSLAYFIDLIIGIDQIFKNTDLQKQLFILLSIIIPTTIFGYIRFYIEQRDLMIVLAFLFMIISWFLLKLADYIPNKIIYPIIIIILVTGTYTQITFADELINNKKDSYLQVREAAEWLKQNSNPNDKIITYSTVQTTYYTDLYTTSVSSEDEILKQNARYFIISVYEQHRQWYIEFPEKHQNILKPVKIYTLNNQPSLIIFEINKNVQNNKWEDIFRYMD